MHIKLFPLYNFNSFSSLNTYFYLLLFYQKK
nr:MAG TPA: hypothetical protein [Caudoviricetes sp.]